MYPIAENKELFDTVMASVQEAGYTIVSGNERTILLDIDRPEDEADFEAMLPIMQQNLGIRVEQRWVSKSGNLHVQLSVDRDLSVIERVAIQACLGSDRKHEFLCLVNAWHGIEEPIKLFKPKYAVSAMPAAILTDDEVPF